VAAIIRYFTQSMCQKNVVKKIALGCRSSHWSSPASKSSLALQASARRVILGLRLWDLLRSKRTVKHGRSELGKLRAKPADALKLLLRMMSLALAKVPARDDHVSAHHA
jgi:hypothetical protein